MKNMQWKKCLKCGLRIYLHRKHECLDKKEKEYGVQITKLYKCDRCKNVVNTMKQLELVPDGEYYIDRKTFESMSKIFENKQIVAVTLDVLK